jgi:hypothetical protein
LAPVLLARRRLIIAGNTDTLAPPDTDTVDATANNV